MNRKLPKVNVLISIHEPNNNWLRNQIENINSQENVDVNLISRFDGFPTKNISGNISSSLLEDYEHLGTGNSFMKLMLKTEEGSVAFCDQDDQWSPNKLHKQVECFSKREKATMAHCDFEFFDDQSQLLKVKSRQGQTSKFTYLFRNPTPGFSMCFNDAARQILVKSHEDFPYNYNHDWWCAMLISILGEIIYIPEKLAKYRLHSNNQIGFKIGKIARIRFYFSRRNENHEKSFQILNSALRFLEREFPNHLNIRFLHAILAGFSKNRLSRFNILARHGIFKSSFSEQLIIYFFYLIPNKSQFNQRVNSL